MLHTDTQGVPLLSSTTHPRQKYSFLCFELHMSLSDISFDLFQFDLLRSANLKHVISKHYKETTQPDHNSR